MKKFALTMVAVMFAAISFAQDDPVNEMFKRYSDREGFTVVNISGDLFNMLSNMDKEDKDLQKLSASVSDFKILVHEGDDQPDFPGFHQLVYEKLDKNAYKELMTVKDHDTDVNFMVKESGGYISELLMIVGGEDDVLMQVKGHFRMSDLAGLTGCMNVNGLEKLKLAEQ
jgi:hypothetical protein